MLGPLISILLPYPRLRYSGRECRHPGLLPRTGLRSEEGRGGRLCLAARRRPAEADDLLPVAGQVVAEDHQKVAGPGGLQTPPDRLLLVEHLGGDALGREAGGDEPLAEQLPHHPRRPAAAVVVLAQEHEIEGWRGGAAQVADVVVPPVAGGGDDPDP